MTTANATEEQTVILGLGAKKRLAFMFETVQPVSYTHLTLPTTPYV